MPIRAIRCFAPCLALLAASFAPHAPAQAQIQSAGWHGLTAVLPGPSLIWDDAISPDSQYVVFTADIDVQGRYELYSVPIGGGAFVKLNPTLDSGGDLNTFDIDPEADRVVYEADHDANDLYELYSVPIAGGSSVKLNPPVSQGIFEFQLAHGSPYVMFSALAIGAGAYQLYGVDTTRGGVQRRNLDLSPGQNVISYRISPTGMQVVYNVSGNSQLGLGDLYATSPFSGDSHILTVADPGFGVRGYDFSFTPDGERTRQSAGHLPESAVWRL